MRLSGTTPRSGKWAPPRQRRLSDASVSGSVQRMAQQGDNVVKAGVREARAIAAIATVVTAPRAPAPHGHGHHGPRPALPVTNRLERGARPGEACRRQGAVSGSPPRPRGLFPVDIGQPGGVGWARLGADFDVTVFIRPLRGCSRHASPPPFGRRCHNNASECDAGATRDKGKKLEKICTPKR